MELLIRKPELQVLVKRITSGLATENDLKRANIEDVRAIKTSGEPQYRLTAGDDIALKTPDEKRAKRYIASDETVDRMGDIIRQKGWDLRNFLKNPQALWAHDARQLPIGRVSENEKGEFKGMPCLFETITYLEEGISPAADAIWKLVEQGLIRAVSVGFLPIKVTWPESAEEREKMGLGPYGVLFEKQEQLELSNCTIPANPNALGQREVKSALREMVVKGEITEQVANELVELGQAKRKIQITIPSLFNESADEVKEIAQAVTTTQETAGYCESVSVGGFTAPFWIINQTGKMQPSNAKPNTPPQKLLAEMDSDPRIDRILEELKQLREELTMLRSEVMKPEDVDKAVIRTLGQRRSDARTMAEAAIARVGQKLAEERS